MTLRWQQPRFLLSGQWLALCSQCIQDRSLYRSWIEVVQRSIGGQDVRPDLIPILVHELGERINGINDLDPALAQDSNGGDEAITEDFRGYIPFLVCVFFDLLRDLHHPTFDQHRLAIFIGQSQCSHHAGRHQHRDVPLL